ncbi:MAG: lipopolysaccharide biosynthesis protein [Ruminococcus sp.]
MIKKLVNLNFSKNQQNTVNVIASVVNMLITALISFCLSPYIVKTIGVEANGFINLANNFITYMTLARTALNSMGSRFLMMAYYKNEDKKVEQYYSSLFFADLILALLLGVIGGFCVWRLEYILDIPVNLISDVKLLFSFLFLNFVISTIITVWQTAPYIKNKLYLDSATSAIHSIIRAAVILGMFLCLTPKVYYVGVGTIFGGVVTYILQFLYKKNLFPNLKAKLSNFSFKAVWELFSSGVWNSISSLGSILTNSLDLFVANVFVGATAMGVLSVAKTMPAFVSSLITTIAAVFTPSLIIDYSKGNNNSIVDTVRQSSKLISVICSIPLAFLIVYGKDFYSLWQPSQNANELHILSIITILGRVFFTGSEPLFHVFTVVNKVKQNSIVTIANGLISILITFILVKFTDLGVYAIAGVSVICCFVKNVVFVIPYSAKYLGLKKTTFFNTVGYSVLCCVILCLWGCLEKLFIKGNTWVSLIISAVIFAIIGVLITTIIVLNKNERKHFISLIKNKVKR